MSSWPPPWFGSITSDDPGTAERTEEILAAGFGDDDGEALTREILGRDKATRDAVLAEIEEARREFAAGNYVSGIGTEPSS